MRFSMSRLSPLRFPPFHRVLCPTWVERNADGDSFESRTLPTLTPAERPLVLTAPDGRVPPELPAREPSDPVVGLVLLLSLAGIVVGGLMLAAWMMGGGK